MTTGRDSGAGWSWFEYGRLSRCPRCTSVAEPPPSRLIASRAPNEISSRASSAEVQPGVDARAAAVAADRQQLVLADAQRAARVAADGDVGVELRRAGGEALAILAVDQRAPVADEQRAGLDEVAGRVGAGARPRGREPDVAVDVHAGARAAPRRGDGSCSTRAVQPHLAQRPVRVAQEEAGDDRLGVASAAHQWSSRVGSANSSTETRVVAQRVPDEVDGGLLAVARADAAARR